MKSWAALSFFTIFSVCQAKAQSIIFPEAVSSGADGFYTIAYSELIPVVVQGIKEQQQQMDKLKTENTQLKNSIELLMKEMEAIKKQMTSSQK